MQLNCGFWISGISSSQNTFIATRHFLKATWDSYEIDMFLFRYHWTKAIDEQNQFPKPRPATSKGSGFRSFLPIRFPKKRAGQNNRFAVLEQRYQQTYDEHLGLTSSGMSKTCQSGLLEDHRRFWGFWGSWKSRASEECDVLYWWLWCDVMVIHTFFNDPTVA